MIADNPEKRQATSPECGVYEILNIVNGKRYVGSSKNLAKRIKEHKSSLRKGSHHAIKLQRSWSKYGEDSFLFKVIELCDPDDRIPREQHHMDIGSPLNSNPRAKNAEGFQHSEESKERRSAMLKERYRNDPEYAERFRLLSAGVPKTDSFKRKMSDRQKGVPKSDSQIINMSKARAVLSERQVLEIIEMRRSGMSIAKICESTGLGYKSVQRVCSGERYKWVEGALSREEADSLRVVLRGPKATRYSDKIYRFYHPAHGERECTQFELKREFPELPPKGVSALSTGRKKTCFGWKVVAAP